MAFEVQSHRSMKTQILAFALAGSLTLLASGGQSQLTPLCSPKILANEVLATGAQRLAAGQIAEPPLTDLADGFAWPDTPVGAIKTAEGYAFFGSDGGSHASQIWHGQPYGNGKYGSITRTLGSAGNPLGSSPPVDVTINPNPDPSVNPYYRSYDYMGGGPVYRVPQGMPGAGNLLVVYHAEIPTVQTQSFLAVLGLAASLDDGMSWTDLGEIIRVNQAYRTDLDGYDIGDPPLVVSPDGQYFYIYFRDWLSNGTTHWENTITLVSVARAPIAAVLADAFGPRPHAAPFQKYYAGDWYLQPGIGGYSTDLNPQAQYGGDSQVAYNAFLQRYVMIVGEGTVVAYAESPDGIAWSLPTLLYDFTNSPGQPTTYVAPIGAGEDPRILGQQFYIYYTAYPQDGQGWTGATVNRFTIACP
jgi:hypothetical protein